MSTATAPKLMTAEEFLALPDDGVERWLIRGQLREKRPGEAGYKAVTRAVSALTAAGALHVDQRPARGGHNTRYHLLDGEGGPLRAVSNGATFMK